MRGAPQQLVMTSGLGKGGGWFRILGLVKGLCHKALPGVFLVFSSLLPARRNLFSASGIFCSGRYQPGSTGISSLLLLKSENIPALLYLGKGPEYRPFRDFLPTGLRHRSQIMEGPVLRPFPYTNCTQLWKQTTMETDVPILVCVMGVCN
jgi:hypothetical protein